MTARHPIHRYAALLIPILAALAGCGEAEEITSERRILKVRTALIHATEELEIERPFTAIVEARRRSTLGFEIGGTITELMVDEGESVARGDSIASLDLRRLEAREQEARAALEEARATLELAEATLTRQEGAAERRAVSLQVVDEARRQVSVAKASVKRLEASLVGVEVDLDQSVLKAPFSGQIAQRMADEGTVVQPGTPVFQLLESGPKEARLGLNAELAATLEIGDELPLFQGSERLEARVLQVLPNRQEGTRTIQLRLLVQDPNDQLRDGDLLTARLPETIEESGYVLPVSALTEGMRGLWAVYVVDEDDNGEPIVTRREAMLLHETEREVYVQGALKDQDQVVVEGVHRLVPGQPVVAISTDTEHESGQPVLP